MKLLFVIHCFSILCLLSINAFSQERIDFAYIGGNEGLSENIVNDIVQDQNGFIWLATNDGLNRYDGYSMTHFRYDPSNPQSLSSNVLECLLLAHDGMLWIGTSDGGLNRYNPQENTFQRYQNNPQNPTSISAGMIDGLSEDNQGNIWVCIRNKGIDRLAQNHNNPGFVHYNTHNLGKQYIASLKSNYSLKIEKARKGGIWVMSEKGIQRIVADNEQADNLPGWGEYANTSAKEIYEHTDGAIWIIYNDGKVVFATNQDNGDSNSPQLVIKKQFKGSEFVGKTSLSSDRQGVLWLSAGNGLLKISADGMVEYRNGMLPLNNLPINRILCTFVDNANVLWLGTYNKGALNYYIDRQRVYSFDDVFLTKGTKELKFLDNAVHSFCEDKFGALWIGTEGGGIVRIREGLSTFLTATSPEKNSYDFFETCDINSAWLPDNNIYCLFNDSKGRIWIGSNAGLTQLEFKPSYNITVPLSHSDFNTKHYSLKGADYKVFGEGAVFVVTEDKFGKIWAASWNGGLHRYLEAENRFEGFYHNPAQEGTLSHNTIRNILFDTNGEAWIGTAGGGLNKMIFPEGVNGKPYFIAYRNDPNDSMSISNNYILNLKKDNEGNIWIGTFGGGLNRMIKPQTPSGKISFKRYTINEKLPNNTIKGILFDENNNLWATTNRDLFRMEIPTGNITQMIGPIKFKLDEFKDNANYQFHNGYMAWGGINGLMVFSPKEFKTDSLSINACLTNLIVENKQINPGELIDGTLLLKNAVQFTENIVLPYNKNTIEIEFSGMNYSNPNGIIYKYYLENYDNTGMMSTRRNVRYTKVPPGDYLFHLKASIGGLNWEGKEKTLRITITPPFWLSIYAYILYGLLILAVGYVVYRIMVYRIKLKTQIKIEHLKLEEAEKTNNLKLQFFTNVSHELRTPLSLISSPIDKLVSDPDINTEQHKLLGMVQRNANRLQNLINQLLDFRKMESGVLRLKLTKGDIVPFVYEVFKAFEDIAGIKLINYRFSCEETAIVCLFDADKIEKMLYNLLSNAFKFTPEKGTIILSLTRRTKTGKGLKKRIVEFLFIDVTDTGIGIKPEEQSKIFEPFYQSDDKKRGKAIGTGIGLAYTYNLVKLHYGKIKLTSQPEQGTKISISLPLDDSVYKDYSIDDKSTTPAKSEYLQDEIKGLKASVTDLNIVLKERDITRGKSTLLIVEDNTELLYYLDNELSPGYNIITAPNGAVGLELSKEHIPDLIISDLMMPEMDGIEMCRLLKTGLETCHIPIIILTAKAGMEAEKEGLETGADEYLVKPLLIELLQLRIKNLLQTKSKLYDQFTTKSDALIFKQATDTKDQELLAMVTNIIINNLDNNNLDIDELSRAIGISRSALYKKIKHITDMSTTEFIRYVKLKEATNLFKQNRYTIEQVTYMVGFSDPKYFRNCFKSVYGKTPSEYIKGLNTV